MRNRKSNNIKTIKDYIVPIVTFIIIFTLIYIFFLGGEGKKTIEDISSSTEFSNGIQVDFGNIDTEVELISNKSKKTILKKGQTIKIGESIIVKSGDVSFIIPEKGEFKLNTNGKISYISNDEIKLESSSLWVESIDSQKIFTKYVSINIGKNSIANIEQNEVSSTIYLLKGSAEIKNLSGISTFLSAGKKIKISNKNASNEKLDMNLLKEDFDDYFKISDWYLKNSNGELIIETNDIKNNSGSLEGNLIDEKEENNNTLSLLNFDNIYDEGNVNSSITNLSGKFADNRISKITINGKKAIVNLENKTFNLLGVDTSKKENDIAIKIYDSEDNLLGKYLYTFYYNSGIKDDKNNNKFTKINTESYPVNGEDFIISIPTVKNGYTFSSENTFYGTVKNPDVKSVTINGYRLKTFNGKTFRYHAYERFKTLGEGINNYEIKYYDVNGNVILKKYITINKKLKKLKNKQKKISEEAGIN